MKFIVLQVIPAIVNLTAAGRHNSALICLTYYLAALNGILQKTHIYVP